MSIDGVCMPGMPSSKPIRDFNMIDSFHLEAYNEKAVNYNRDVEAFPVTPPDYRKDNRGTFLL
jgi:hypothetical protein